MDQHLSYAELKLFFSLRVVASELFITGSLKFLFLYPKLLIGLTTTAVPLPNISLRDLFSAASIISDTLTGRTSTSIPKSFAI